MKSTVKSIDAIQSGRADIRHKIICELALATNKKPNYFLIEFSIWKRRKKFDLIE